MDLETLVVAFGADLTGLTAGVSGAKALIAGFGLAAIGVGVAAVKMAGDFDAGMLTIKTGAGGVNENLKQLSSSVLALGPATGTGTKQLIDGLFMIESSGQRGSQAIDTLTKAAEGAKVGGAELGVVANGVTTIMTDFSDKNITAAQATNTLIAAVGDGKTKMQDLAASLSSILPVASSTKVGLNDVMGAMATMTAEGVPAADAATYLRQMLMTLAAPSKAGSTALKEIGLSAQQVSDSMKVSLPDTLKMIEDHLKKKFPEGSIAYQDALKAIAGGSKQMQGMLDLTGAHLSTFGSNVTDIAGKVKKGGDSIVGWSDVQQDFNFKIDQAKASMEVFMITLGSKLLPILGPIVSNIANVVGQFTAWINSAHPLNDALSLTGKYAQIALPILAGLGALVLAVLVPAFWAWASATIVATWPILAIVAAVAGLTAIFVHLYQTNAGFKAFIDNIANGFKQAWQVISTNFMPIMKQVGDFLKSTVLPALQQVGSFLASTFQPVWQSLVQLWQSQLLPLFKQLWGALQPALPAFEFLGKVIGGIVVVSFGILISMIAGAIKAIAAIASDIGSAIGGIVQIITGVVQVVSGIVRFIYDLFTGNFGALKGDLGAIWQGIVNIFGGAFQVIGSLVHGFINGILSFFGGFIQNIIGFFQGLFDKLVGHSIIPDMINGIIHWFLSLPSAIWGGITSFVGGVIDRFNAFKSAAMVVISSMVSGIGNAFHGLGSLISSIWGGIWGSIKQAINWIIGGIDGFIRGIDSIHVNVPGIGNVGFNIPQIPMLAGGGFLAPGQVGLTGEHGPEYTVGGPSGTSVIGTSQSAALMRGGGQTVIHNHIYINEREIAHSVMVEVVNEMRSSGHPVGAI